MIINVTPNCNNEWNASIEEVYVVIGDVLHVASLNVFYFIECEEPVYNPVEDSRPGHTHIKEWTYDIVSITSFNSSGEEIPTTQPEEVEKKLIKTLEINIL